MGNTYQGYTGKNTDSIRAINARARAWSDDEDEREEAALAAEQKRVADEIAAAEQVEKNKPNTFWADTVNNVGGALGWAANEANERLPSILGLDPTKALREEILNEDALREGDTKVDEAVAKGELAPEAAQALKDQVHSLSKSPTLTDIGSQAAEFSGVPSFVRQAQNSAIIGQTEGSMVLDDELSKTYLSFVDEDEKAGRLTPEEAKIARDRIAKKVESGKTAIKKATETTGAAPSQSEGALSTLDTAAILAGGAGVASKIAKTRNATKAAEAVSDTATAGEAPQKLLNEPGEAFYADRRREVAEELDATNNLDEEYLSTQNLMSEVKSTAQREAETIIQSPERVRAQREATQLLSEAEDQLQYYQDLILKTPYFRKVDEVNVQKSKEIDELQKVAQGEGIDFGTFQSMVKDIEASYQPKLDNLARQYPEEAAQGPALNQAIEQASRARLEANDNLGKVMAEDQAVLQGAGGPLHVPDPVKIKAHQQKLQNEIAEIDSKVSAAKYRALNPAATSDQAHDKIADIIDPELSPESFDEVGNVTPKAGERIQQVQAERADAIAKGENHYEPPQKGDLTDPTTGETAPNAGYERLMAADYISPATKKAMTNLTHKVHKDKILKTEASQLVKEDLNAARELFYSRDLVSKNPDSHIFLGNELAHYYDLRGMAKESGQVYDEMIGAGSILARGLRSLGAANKVNPRYIMKHAEAKAKDAGKPLDQATLNQMEEAVKEVEKLPDGDEKIAALLNLREMAEQKSVWRKMGEWTSATLALPRGLLATGDISFVGRQGALAGSSHPVIWSRALGRSLRYAFSPKFFDKDMERLATLKDKHGEDLANAFDDMKLSLDGVQGRSDEAFGASTKILESKLLKKALVGHVFAGADRAYTGAATFMRGEIAKSIVNGMGGVKKFDSLPKKTKQDLGRVIDTSTGRGRGGDPMFGDRSWFETAAPALSNTLFAARFWKSRLDAINPVYYAQLSGPARKEAVKNAASFATLITTVLAAAKASGADVEGDPRSSDFMKIKVGDTRYDIMGGLQQNIVALTRQITGQYKNANGDVVNLGPGPQWDSDGNFAWSNEGTDPFGPNRLSMAGDFVQNKTSPLINTGLQIAEGKDRAGNELNPQELLIGLLLPLGVQGTMDAYNNSGGDTGLAVGSAASNFVGIGANTYGSNNTALSSSDKAKIEKAPAGQEDIYKAFYQAAGNVTGRNQRDKLITELYERGEVEKARRKAAEFNLNVDEKMKSFFQKYPNIDEELQDELRTNLYITITTAGEKRRMEK